MICIDSHHRKYRTSEQIESDRGTDKEILQNIGHIEEEIDNIFTKLKNKPIPQRI